MKRIIMGILTLVVMSVLLIGCGNSEGGTEDIVKYITPEVANNTISVNKTAISENPIYVNYDSDGTTVQLIMVVASDGTYRVSLNTCQSCTPSPLAYFEEINGKLVCKNCGNAFTMDDVGVSARGCHPMTIEYTDDNTTIVISTSTLDNFAKNFSNWGGPVS